MSQTFAAMLTVFVLGLCIGANLGTLMMCLLSMSARQVQEVPAL